MNVDKRWLLLLTVAASAAAGAVFASKSRGRQRWNTHDLQHKKDVKAWENEGGNLAPVPVGSVTP